LKVLSIWDRHHASASAIEQGLINQGAKLESVVRSLVVDVESLEPWVTYLRSDPLEMRNRSTLMEKLLRVLSHQRFKLLVRARIRNQRPDVILVHFGQTGARFIRMAARKKIPIVIGFYGHDVSAALQSRRWLWNYRKFVKFNCTLIAMCEEARQRLISIGCTANQIEIWNIPINFNQYPLTKRQYSGGNVTAITCARFIEKKGYPRLFSAMSELKNQGILLNLEAIGYAGNLTVLKTAAEGYGVAEQIVWHCDLTGVAFHEIYSQLLAKSDLFLLAAMPAENGDDEGGAPLSVITAQATGIPIITTQFTGFETTLIQGETGFLCKEPVINSIVEYVKDYIGKAPYFHKIGIEGSKKARSEFDFVRQSEKLYAILQDTQTVH